jgi:hypothetical protein
VHPLVAAIAFLGRDRKDFDDERRIRDRGLRSVLRIVFDRSQTIETSGYVARPVARTRTRMSDVNTVLPEGRVAASATMMFAARALWRAVPPDIARISPASNSCLTSLSRSSAR